MPWPGTGHPRSPMPMDTCPRNGLVRTRGTPRTSSGGCWPPLVPVGGTRPGFGGRPVSYPRRDVVDAIRYVARTGCQWDALPVDFPPAPLVKHYFTTWTRDG